MNLPSVDRFVPLLQFAGIVAPTLYAGLTVQHSIGIREFIDFAPPKVLAKQWFQLYRRGPAWVPPLVVTGTISNALLAWRFFALSHSLRNSLPFPLLRGRAVAYAVAAVGFFAVMPLTVLWFEPGINGACKLKVEATLADEGFRLPPRDPKHPRGVDRHTASEAAARWAESASLKELVAAWGTRNHLRWVIAGAAAAVSGLATLAL